MLVGERIEGEAPSLTAMNAAGGAFDWLADEPIVPDLPKSDRGKVLRDRLREDWTARMKVPA